LSWGKVEQMDFDREAVLASFLVETQESLDLMEQSLLEIESSATGMDLLHDIFRSAHTIKGNAFALELRTLAGFAHVVEDLLHVLREHKVLPDQGLVSLLLSAVDEVRLMVPAAVAGVEELTPEQRIIKERIAQQVQRRSQDSTAAGLTNSESIALPQVKSETSANGPARTLRADVARLDRMLNLILETVISQGRLRRTLEELRVPQAAEILEIYQETERLFIDLQDEMMRVRMVPMSAMFRHLVRSVRDMAGDLGKIARLETSGMDVEVDTTVLEHLKDPLVHMIRNAVDHGIERPEVRHSQGKPACGVIKLSAVHSSGSVIVTVQDDGAGIDRRKILEKAKRMDLLPGVERISEQEIYRLVFRAGFSTAEAVTGLSGRGVGLDVVRRNIDRLRGTVDISSKEGKGTTLTIRLPLTLAIIDGFAVKAGDDTFLIPLDYVTECAEISPVERNCETSGILNLRGSAVPYVRLRQAFGSGYKAAERENVVIVKVGDFRAGIAVDQLLGGMQAVVKPLGKMFQSVSAFAGSTILGDGRVGLIIDVPGLLGEMMQANLQPQLS
jgi:two-component system chemotaxis sensor kinase CheA